MLLASIQSKADGIKSGAVLTPAPSSLLVMQATEALQAGVLSHGIPISVDILFFMILHPLFRHAARAFTLRQWVTIVVISLLLALASGLFLAVGAGFQMSEPWAGWYDRSELFVRDTIRLTFQDRSDKPVVDRPYETVFMAPPGILEQNKQFNWLAEDVLADATVSATVLQEAALPVSPAGLARVKVPNRMLEPDWQPDFKGQ